MIDSNLPLIDLHRHLDGNVRLETILDLAQQNNIRLPGSDLDSLRPFVQVIDPQPSVMDFINKFKWPMSVLTDYESCRRIACENVEDAWHEGIDYIELRFSPSFMAHSHNLDPYGVVEAVCKGVESGRQKFGIKVNIIGILSRTYGVDNAWDELQAILSQRDRIIAVDLAGDEANFPGELFIKHFKIVRENGLKITIHAGEISGPESIWQAILELGACRIGHAITATQDPNLLDYLAENGIGIESNLTSNVQTNSVADYASHPLKTFIEKGILATINTDDPGISGIDLHHEYCVAAVAAGLSASQIHQAQMNALKISFLNSEERDNLLL